MISTSRRTLIKRSLLAAAASPALVGPGSATAQPVYPVIGQRVVSYNDRVVDYRIHRLSRG